MPTELGMTTIELLTQYFPNLIDVPFSAHMENELDAISEHKTKKETVLKEFYGPFEKELEIADREIPVKPQEVIVSDVKCEKCGRMMVVKQGVMESSLPALDFRNAATRNLITKNWRRLPALRS